jgi:hypothetical protein
VSDELVFYVLNGSVLPGWVLLCVAPRAKVTRVLVHSGLYPLALAVAYTFLLFGDQPGPQGAHFFSLAGVTNIFTTPRTILACWVHYLVFDLFVGAWEVRDAGRRGIAHWRCIPSVLLTLMFGPLGLASWLVVRALHEKGVTLDESR